MATARPHPLPIRDTNRTVGMGARTLAPTDGYPDLGTSAPTHDTERRIALRPSVTLLEHLLTRLQLLEANLGADGEHDSQLSQRAVHG
ncbi:hypothetical protein [Streptomyces agglomeratus]|uniref:hypothetical protein n=1 Tax=Streptomyces agglomeratus TaxID=285458 RepID=UPI00159F047D|nr:hypothetical protein [Streptomyces agglomeratus]